MERILGLDVGDKTIGVAVSDPLGITAQGITTIRRSSLDNDISQIKDIIKEYNVSKIVVGLPKNMNNSLGTQGQKVMKFAGKLKRRLNLDIEYEDERLTTVMAEKILIQGDLTRSKRKKVIDKVAATYILQSYLDRKNKEGEHYE